MSNSAIIDATAADARRCFEVLTLAFESDPPSRWIWPGQQQYLEAFPRFAEAFGGGAIGLGAAHYFEGFAGVALWLPPGAAPAEELLVSVIRETVSGERRDAMFSIFEQMDAYHPREAHWHLPLIGVHPDSQGRGVGSALLRQVLDRCDRDSVPAYLEATSPRNVALYQRNGFEKLGGIEVADCPPIVPMLRKPR
jgi:GNAT superfamily N-acetyltransferase